VEQRGKSGVFVDVFVVLRGREDHWKKTCVDQEVARKARAWLPQMRKVRVRPFAWIVRQSEALKENQM
jgi:hypothetical protein